MNLDDSQTIILLVLYCIIMFILYLLWQGPKSNRSKLIRFFSNKSGGEFEYQLLREFIAACTVTESFENTLQAIGSHSANMLEADRWYCVVQVENGEVFRTGSSILLDSDDKEQINTIGTEMESWLRSNPYPLAISANMLAQLSSGDDVLSMPGKRPSLILPLVSKKMFVGFILLWNSSRRMVRRADQFLELFVSVATEFARKSVVENQQKRIRAQQQRAEKMAALGNLASSVAHEIRNPLTFIRAVSEQVMESPNIQNNERELMVGVLEEVDRINSRIHELLNLAKVTVDSTTKIDLKQIVKKVDQLIKPKLESGEVTLQCLLPETDLEIIGNDNQISQVLLNLCLNAFQATPKGGLITLSVKEQNEKILIEVSDTGAGIPEALQNKIFEPFFTTKEDGTGLGLATSYRIVEAHAGTLSLVKSDSRGSVFQIILPTIQGNS